MSEDYPMMEPVEPSGIEDWVRYARAQRARAEQAEAARADLANVVQFIAAIRSDCCDASGYCIHETVRSKLAATTPGEPPTCPTCGATEKPDRRLVRTNAPVSHLTPCGDVFHDRATTPGEPR